MFKVILFVLLLLLGILNASADEFPNSRPNENNEPTKVMVSLYVIDIEHIDNKNQSFTADVVVRLKWKDERLAGTKEPISLNSIWNPNIHIYNLRKLETHFPKVVTVSSDGWVQYTQRYYTTLSSPLDFTEFPFDQQKLPISLLAFGFTPDQVEMVFETAGGSEKFSISDWQIEAVGATVSNLRANMFNDGSEEIVRPKLDYVFSAHRYIQYYWWKVLAPLMLILFLSWAVFWIDPSQVAAQIGVSGTSILTLIAFLFRLENILPPVSYLTHIDHFIFTTLIMVFFSYMEALVSTTFALKGKKVFAQRLDMVFRIGYPIIFVVIIFIFWIR